MLTKRFRTPPCSIIWTPLTAESRNPPPTLEIVRASAEQASYLDIITGDPMFYMSAYFLDAEGQPLVIGRQYIVGSRFVFNI